MDALTIKAARDAIQCGKFKVFSFDVFDTTLLRRCTSPRGVFERAFELAPIPEHKRGMAEAFAQQRRIAETKVRQRAIDLRNSPEVTIDEIYEVFPVHIFDMQPENRLDLVAAEYAAELDLCFFNRPALELLQEARQAGLHIGFTSDTYWNEPRLSKLLQSCCPDLEWDFLYASCDHRTGKTGTLFASLLSDLKIKAEQVVHIGDTIAADVSAPQRMNMHAIHAPLCSSQLMAVLERERELFRMFHPGNTTSLRLDDGICNARQAAASLAKTAKEERPAINYGINVFGPILMAFNRFVKKRVQQIEQSGGKAAVLFLGRDGLAPLEIWQATASGPASYIEINRRVALLSSAHSLEPLVNFFSKVPTVNLAVTKQFLKIETPRLRKYFRRLKDGTVKGKTFAENLPKLISEQDLSVVSQELRGGLLAHLRSNIPNFDEATDLILVDLGYSGTVQKALRSILSAAGLPHRLHGLYVLTSDEDFQDLANGDSVDSMLSDAILLPQTKRALLVNISVFEQMCSSAEGSVREYDTDGTVHREPDPRSDEQLQLCREIRKGAVCYAEALTKLGQEYRFPREDIDNAWGATMLARALLLPTDTELSMLMPLKHDVNLGSQAMMPLIAPSAAGNIVGAMDAATAMTKHSPLGWMAASLAALSPQQGYLYSIHATHNLPMDVFGDVPCGNTTVMLFGRSGDYSLSVTCLRTNLGELRLRIPLIRVNSVHTVAIPSEILPNKGIVRHATVQCGEDAPSAMKNTNISSLDDEAIQAIGMTLENRTYKTVAEDAHLLFTPPPLDQRIGILTLTIASLNSNRLLAINE